MGGLLFRGLSAALLPRLDSAVALVFTLQSRLSRGFLQDISTANRGKAFSNLRLVPSQSGVAPLASHHSHPVYRASTQLPWSTPTPPGAFLEVGSHSHVNSGAAEQRGILPGSTMAWRSHGRNNSQLVENLRRNGVFSDQEVYETMLKVRGPCYNYSPFLQWYQCSSLTQGRLSTLWLVAVK